MISIWNYNDWINFISKQTLKLEKFCYCFEVKWKTWKNKIEDTVLYTFHRRKSKRTKTWIDGGILCTWEQFRKYKKVIIYKTTKSNNEESKLLLMWCQMKKPDSLQSNPIQLHSGNILITRFNEWSTLKWSKSYNSCGKISTFEELHVENYSTITALKKFSSILNLTKNRLYCQTYR